MKPHRLSWFRQQIGKTIRRKQIDTYDVIEIFVEDNKQCQRLFHTQFDLGLRYFTDLKKKQYNQHMNIHPKVMKYDEVTIIRKYETEIRCCNCYSQSCKGRFLVKVGSPFTVCSDEAFKLKIIKTIDEYYKQVKKNRF